MDKNNGRERQNNPDNPERQPNPASQQKSNKNRDRD